MEKNDQIFGQFKYIFSITRITKLLGEIPHPFVLRELAPSLCEIIFSIRDCGFRFNTKLNKPKFKENVNNAIDKTKTESRSIEFHLHKTWP